MMTDARLEQIERSIAMGWRVRQPVVEELLTEVRRLRAAHHPNCGRCGHLMRQTGVASWECGRHRRSDLDTGQQTG